MTSLAAIHVAKKQLGMDEETYRSFLLRETGVSSAKDLDERGVAKAMAAFERAGFKKTAPRRPDGRAKLTGKYAPKIQALWIAAWNLGLVRNRDDAALLAFVKRQAKVDHTRFLLDAAEAAKVIEALKDWQARGAGVDWTADALQPEWTQAAGYRIVRAQFRMLRAAGDLAEFASLRHWLLATFRTPAEHMDDKAWIAAMNTLGTAIRTGKVGRS